jgi:CDP-glucose 4,6-dehydratase
MEGLEITMVNKYFFRNKNILVTGGGGFVGSHLVKRLIGLGANVVVSQRNNNPRSFFTTERLEKKVQRAHLDVKDKRRVFDAVTKYEIDSIFHLAAQAIVTTAYCNPSETLETNVMGTVNILEAARLYSHVKGIIIASSDKAYGKLKKSKYLETDPLRGDHPYDVSKSAADLIAQAYYKTYHLPVAITRFGNIYGEGDLNLNRIVPGIMMSLINKQILEVRSDGKDVREYVYVDNVIDGYLDVLRNMETTQGEAFNIGSKDTLSVVELIKKIEKILGKKVDYKILNISKNEIPYQSLDYSKIQEKTGWQPKYSLEKVIPKIYLWYKKNKVKFGN